MLLCTLDETKAVGVRQADMVSCTVSSWWGCRCGLLSSEHVYDKPTASMLTAVFLVHHKSSAAVLVLVLRLECYSFSGNVAAQWLAAVVSHVRILMRRQIHYDKAVYILYLSDYHLHRCDLGGFGAVS